MSLIVLLALIALIAAIIGLFVQPRYLTAAAVVLLAVAVMLATGGVRVDG